MHARRRHVRRVLVLEKTRLPALHFFETEDGKRKKEEGREEEERALEREQERERERGLETEEDKEKE